MGTFFIYIGAGHMIQRSPHLRPLRRRMQVFWKEEPGDAAADHAAGRLV